MGFLHFLTAENFFAKLCNEIGNQTYKLQKEKTEPQGTSWIDSTAEIVRLQKGDW